MQPYTLLALGGCPDDKIGARNKIAQFAQILRQNGTLVQILRLPVNQVQAVKRPLKTQIGTDNTHIVGHDFLQLLAGLGDQHHFLVQFHALGIPKLPRKY